jgi:UDP-N-acetyl-2-amino-2-deoxyglucuronate dehydrogenase
MSNKIGFAVLGLGHIGQKHCMHISNNPNAALIAIADINSDLKYENFINHVTIDNLLSNKHIDVVNICTPNGLHAQQAIQCLNANKHVVIEKPMALSTNDSKEIEIASIKNNKFVFCVMQNRFSPPSQWLKNLILSKTIGKIFSIQINCFWNRDDRYYTPNHWHGNMILDGGPLFTQFSHFIDLLYWIFGEININYAQFENFNHSHSTEFEDSGIVTFSINSGGVGSINYSTSVFDTNFESSISIIGENGTVKLGGQYMNEISYCNIKNYQMPTLEKSNPPNNYGNYQGSASNHPFVIQNVIETLNNTSSPHTKVTDGMAVVKIIEDIYKFRK